MIPNRLSASLLSTLVLLAGSLFAHAATITGTVSDRTTNKVAAHDTVVLIGFGQGMQEVARTTTDEHGRYTLQVPDDGTHLVRVDHEKATYFQPAPPAAHTVDVDVYDVSEKVTGISTEADVLSMQTDQTGLHVVENYFVKNDSHPAMTQLSRKAFEIYLPAGAKIDASAAMGPAGMPVASSPIPVGDPNHYAFVFPIRPGETRFQISYHLDYSGSMQFSHRDALPTENLVVMLPKTMDFKPGGTDFQPIPDNVASQTFVRKGVSPGQPVSFTISGSGSMPREAQNGSQQQSAEPGTPSTGQGQPTAAQPGGSEAGVDTRPGGGLGPPIDTPDPLNKYKWWILSGLALVLVAAAGWLLRKPRVAHPAALVPSQPDAADGSWNQPSQQAPQRVPLAAAAIPTVGTSMHGGLLPALKDALFALESERLSGQVSEDEYRQLRASLDVVLRQALERGTASSLQR